MNASKLSEKSLCQLFCSNVTHLFCLLWSFLVPYSMVSFGFFLSLWVFFQSFLVPSVPFSDYLGTSSSNQTIDSQASIFLPASNPTRDSRIAERHIFLALETSADSQNDDTSSEQKQHLAKSLQRRGPGPRDLFYNRKTIKLLNSHDTIWWCLYRNTLEIQP